MPLNRRVAAPKVELPADTDAVTWRSASTSDIEAILDCEREISVVDHPHYVTTGEEVEEDFEQSYFDAERDSLIGATPDGRVLAWGLVLEPPGQDTLVREILVGGVRPASRGQGLGRQVLAWQVARGEQRLAASALTIPGWLMAFADQRADAAAHLYARFGLSPARYFLELRRDLSEPIAAVELDAELRLVPFSAEWSEATRLARNDSFRDHWGSQPSLEEPWLSFVERSTIRPDLSFLAVAPDDHVAGFVISSVVETDWPGQGFSSAYIDLVGVTRQWRRRGIAPALLTRTLLAVAAAGLDKAVLDVDSDSPTGALGLYTGVGFAESNRSINFTKVY
ncbi:MAG: GNAT family N-acetyltransferase [Rhodoglobus sp.]